MGKGVRIIDHEEYKFVMGLTDEQVNQMQQCITKGFGIKDIDYTFDIRTLAKKRKLNKKDIVEVCSLVDAHSEEVWGRMYWLEYLEFANKHDNDKFEKLWDDLMEVGRLKRVLLRNNEIIDMGDGNNVHMAVGRRKDNFGIQRIKDYLQFQGLVNNSKGAEVLVVNTKPIDYHGVREVKLDFWYGLLNGNLSFDYPILKRDILLDVGKSHKFGTGIIEKNKSLEIEVRDINENISIPLDSYEIILREGANETLEDIKDFKGRKMGKRFDIRIGRGVKNYFELIKQKGIYARLKPIEMCGVA